MLPRTVILLFLVVLAGTAALTGFMRRYALSRQLLDLPNARSSHITPTPRGGGVAIVLTVLFGIMMLRLSGIASNAAFGGLFVGGALVAGIGYLDDRGHIPAHWRLLVHLGAAATLLAFTGDLPPLPGLAWLSGIPSLLAAALFVVWMLNLYNFMDGIDGIAGIEALTVCGAASALLWLHAEPALAALTALYGIASAGFLLWNWPPAKIFMGDTGSGFLGFSLAGLALLTWVESGFPIWAWLILLGVFLIDATWTLVRRVLLGQRFYEAHRLHAYQYAARRYHAHRPVTLAVGLINVLWLFPLAALAARQPQWGLLLLTISWAPLLCLAWRFNAGIPETD